MSVFTLIEHTSRCHAQSIERLYYTSTSQIHGNNFYFAELKTRNKMTANYNCCVELHNNMFTMCKPHTHATVFKMCWPFDCILKYNCFIYSNVLSISNMKTKNSRKKQKLLLKLLLLLLLSIQFNSQCVFQQNHIRTIIVQNFLCIVISKQN